MKLYNLEFFQVNYAQDIANGINLNAKLAYEQRKPLFNTTDYSFLKEMIFIHPIIRWLRMILALWLLVSII